MRGALTTERRSRTSSGTAFDIEQRRSCGAALAGNAGYPSVGALAELHLLDTVGGDDRVFLSFSSSIA
jgi:hypothetical protein